MMARGRSDFVAFSEKSRRWCGCYNNVSSRSASGSSVSGLKDETVMNKHSFYQTHALFRYFLSSFLSHTLSLSLLCTHARTHTRTHTHTFSVSQLNWGSCGEADENGLAQDRN